MTSRPTSSTSAATASPTASGTSQSHPILLSQNPPRDHELGSEVSLKHRLLDRLIGRHRPYRKVIVEALRHEDLRVELPSDLIAALHFAVAKTGIAPDELVIDALRDAFGSIGKTD